MNKKLTTAMAGNIALAMIMATGCQSLMTNRTAMGSGDDDPYSSAPVVNIEERGTSTPDQITPKTLGEEADATVAEAKETAKKAEEDTEAKIAEAEENANEKIAEAEKDAKEAVDAVDEQAKKEPSYQKYIIPADYKNPTEGLTPTKERPDRSAKEEEKAEAADAPATVDEDGNFTYIVKSGDCLSVIANSNGVKTKELAKINNINVDTPIFVGQKLKIPAGRKPFESKKEEKVETPADDSVYVVKSGDCLSVIAKNYGVKTSDFMNENNLENANQIYVGQKLKIPGKAKKAPTAETPATNEPAPTKEPKNEVANEAPAPVAEKEPVKNDPFDLDQKTEDKFAPAAQEEAPAPATETKEKTEAIVVPPAPVEAEETVEEADPFDIDSVIQNFENNAQQKANEVIEKIENVKVEKGDTLELIAANYSTTAEELRKLNGFDSSKKLKAGEIIKIPAQTTK